MTQQILKDSNLSRAVSRILQRSERQQDIEKLQDTFVDVGVLAQLNNANNQVIYGRRGTGKTHVFRVLPTIIQNRGTSIVAYIDARTLGSTNQFSDMTLPIGARCVSLFRDVLGEIHNSLLDFVVALPTTQADSAMDSLAALSSVITESLSTARTTAVVDHISSKGSTSREVGLSAQRSGITLKGGLGRSEETSAERTVSRQVLTEDKIIFPELNTHLNDILARTNSELYILFDEWSSLPMELQPYLAEFFKRSFIPNARIILKIAALEYRSRFGEPRPNGGFLGVELGGDIASTLDLDDYYVYDRSPDFVARSFANMLFRHLGVDLPSGYLSNEYGVGNGVDLSTKLFTSKGVFDELVRASEGVIRDLINIFTTAFFDAQRRDVPAIDKKGMLEAARQWYEKDKASTLDAELSQVLQRIVNEVIGKRRARSFMIESRLEKHPVVQRLFDFRVIHLLKRGYADKENPGLRYNIYNLDYGTYVDLLNTSKQPIVELQEMKDGLPNQHDFVVPFDDKRSIRRNIVTEELLTAGSSVPKGNIP